MKTEPGCTATVEKMEAVSQFFRLQELIVRDRYLIFTSLSYVMILAIFVNLTFSLSPAVGILSSIIYFLINGMFLGTVFFENQDLLLRLVLGILVLIVLLGTVAWAVLITYNLDVLRSVLVLCIVAASCSFLNKRMKRKVKNAPQ